MGSYSIVRSTGYCEGGRCGYCKSPDRQKSIFGIWAYELDVFHYNGLLDRGMRRSGMYVYKPIIEKTCCPQYTIRLDVHKFFLRRSQKKVLRQMSEFLMFDRRPKVLVEEAALKFNCSWRQKTSVCKKKLTPTNKVDAKDENLKRMSSEEQKHIKLPLISEKQITSEAKPKGIKKKIVRRERAFKRMREQGLDVSEVVLKRAEAESARQKTLESLIALYDPTKAVHKFEINLLKLHSTDFSATEQESFHLYKKYQETVHEDDNVTIEGFRRFLCSTPLIRSETSIYGTYHQQYRLDGKLIAVGVIDILPCCLSSTYFFYDPDYKFLSLGTYAALREIAYTKELAKTWRDLHYYYMGYYVESCPKMRYKSRFQPSDLLCDTSFTWVPFEECKEKLCNSERVLAFANDVPPPVPIPVGSVLCLHKRRFLCYADLLKPPYLYIETDRDMEDYARLLGPLAQKIVLYKE